MDSETLSLLDCFDTIAEVVQTLLVSNADADYRIEILKCHKGARKAYKPRIYRQEAMCIPVISGRTHYPKPPERFTPQERFVWRDYEMGFGSVEDPQMALKMAVAVIKNQKGR